MKRSIWKYELTVAERQLVRMPVGARILCAQMQRDRLCLWAVVDEEAKREPRVFSVFGTGHPFTAADDAIYIGTVQDGPYVWHLFEIL